MFVKSANGKSQYNIVQPFIPAGTALTLRLSRNFREYYRDLRLKSAFARKFAKKN
jgi:hypothetical protein